MKTAFYLPSDLQKFSRAACAAVAGVLFCAFAGVLPCAAQTPPIVIPYTINTIAGNGSSGLTGNGGPATAAELSNDLRAMAVDAQGNVYIADTGNNVVREINAATGIITTVAGGASAVCNPSTTDDAGDGCIAATQTTLDEPRGIALDKAGNLYIADYGGSQVHVVNKLTGIMSVVAGPGADKSHGVKSYSGDGGPAKIADVDEPRGVRVDNTGNIWICDTGNNVIREINASTGIITTVVGSDSNGTSAAPGGFAGDGGPASGAELNEPTDIVFDSANNAYIVDFNNKRIRKVTAINGQVTSSSQINTIIGNGGTPPTTAPTGPQTATTTPLGSPTKIDIDAYGNLYFSDSGESVIYFYDAAAQTLSIIAGEFDYAGTATGFPVCANSSNTLGDGCPATQSVFYQGGNSALGMALDGNNNLYITDPADDRIREVSTNLSFSAATVGQSAAQTLSLHFSVNDLPAGGVTTPTGITVGSSLNDFAIVAASPSCTTNSDTTTNCTVQVSFNPVDPGLRAAPLAIQSTKSHNSFPLVGTGNGALGSFDPGATSLVGSGLSGAKGSAFDAAGNLYIADTGNNRVVKIAATTQTQTIFAGTGTAGSGGNGGLATAATLNAPSAVAVSPNGRVYIADTGNNVIRAVDPVTGDISTYAGGGTVCSASTALFGYIDSEGDGCPATQATLQAPSGLATDSYDNLYIADTGNNLIRSVDPRTGSINLYAGLKTGTTICSAPTDTPYGDGCVATQAAFSGPSGLTMDGSGNLFVADTGDNLIRAISLGTGLVTKVAGNGQSAFGGDGGLATAASLNGPTAVTEDAAGDLYIADTGNSAVRLIASTSGNISTLAGQGGTAGSAGGTGNASQLQFKSPSGLAIDSAGDVYVSDTGNSRVVEDNRNLGTLAFGNDNITVVTPAQTATFSDTGNAALTFTNSPPYTATGNTSDFSISASASTACSGSGIAKSANCTLTATFDPAATGSFTDNITVNGNAVNQSTATLRLTGAGVQLATTKLTLVQTSPTGSVSYGQSATFTATVAPTSGSGTPTGSVTFSIDGTPQPQSVPLSSSDTATLTISLTVSSTGHVIEAIYSGDGTYATSNSSITVPVSQAGTTTTLTISPTTQIQGQPVTFTSQVTSLTTGIPTGTVTFMYGTTVLNTATLNAQGQASYTTSALPVATYSFIATYQGVTNSNYASSSSSTQSLVVNPIPAGFTATASPTTLSVPQGGTVQTVLNLLPAGGITGTVSFACTGLPANTTCGFFPTTVSLPTLSPSTDCTPSSATAVCTTLTITTNVPPLALQSQMRPLMGNNGARILSAAVFFPALLFGLGLFKRKDKRISMLVLTLALLAGFGALSGCASNATQTAALPTPAGTSTVTVTMTGPNNITQTITLTLNVLAATPVTAQLDRPMPPMLVVSQNALAASMLKPTLMLR